MDGTKEFIARCDQFSICIALSHNHNIEAGAVFSPTNNELYYAARGMGAYKIQTDGKTLPDFFSNENRIHVSNRKNNLIAMVSRYHIDEKTAELLKKGKLEGRISDIISAGSALKGCRIAAGEADLYYRLGDTMEWDTAANQVIVEEAGGIMRQLDPQRNEFIYNRKDSLSAYGFFILNDLKNDLVSSGFFVNSNNNKN